jgi:Asp-tRNA(Asn)/Glu-tRNA(Gln) amidotransferase C subunit
MSVSPQDVEKVALLARLTISETDLAEVTERFGRVLQLVAEHDRHERCDTDVQPSRYGAATETRCSDADQ